MAQETATNLEFIAKAQCCSSDCCPTLFRDKHAVHNQSLVIKDDFDGEVRMSPEQFQSLCEAYLSQKER